MDKNKLKGFGNTTPVNKSSTKFKHIGPQVQIIRVLASQTLYCKDNRIGAENLVKRWFCNFFDYSLREEDLFVKNFLDSITKEEHEEIDKEVCEFIKMYTRNYGKQDK